MIDFRVIKLVSWEKHKKNVPYVAQIPNMKVHTIFIEQFEHCQSMIISDPKDPFTVCLNIHELAEKSAQSKVSYG